jgi:hypothetical protein
MLRISIAAAFLVLSTSAFAQFMEPRKDIRFGVGCITPVNTFSVRLGACRIDDEKSRVWCPNGDIFDREGSDFEHVLSAYVVRSICRLNQIL